MEGGLPSPLGRQAWVPLQFQRAPISQDHPISGSRSCPPPPNPLIVLSAAPRLPALNPQIQSSPLPIPDLKPQLCRPKPEYAQSHLSSPSPHIPPTLLASYPQKPHILCLKPPVPHLHTPFPIFTSFSLSPFPCLEHPDHSPCHLCLTRRRPLPLSPGLGLLPAFWAPSLPLPSPLSLVWLPALSPVHVPSSTGVGGRTPWWAGSS